MKTKLNEVKVSFNNGNVSIVLNTRREKGSSSGVSTSTNIQNALELEAKLKTLRKLYYCDKRLPAV